MGLEKYITKKTIKKTIDPTAGLGLNISRPIPKEFDIPDQTKKTPVSILLGDLLAQATDVIGEANAVATEIYEANKTDPGFIHYVDVVQKSRPDLSSRVYRTIQTISHSEVKAAERDVFRRLIDPRAPFIRDLYRISDEVSSISLNLQDLWTTLTTPNRLYSSYETSRVVKYSLLKEQQYLALLKNHTQQIKNNNLQMVSACLVRGLVRGVIDKSFSRISEVEGKSIDSLIHLLETIRATTVLLQTSQINITEYWEDFQENVGRSFKDMFTYIGKQAVNQVAFTFFGGVENKIFDYLGSLSQLIDASTIDGGPCIDLVEFRDQIGSSLHLHLSKVEDFLLERERLAHEVDENRQAAILTSQKNSKTNQFVYLLNSLIQELEKLRVSTINVDNQTVAALTNKLMGSIKGYPKLIAVGGSK